MGKDKVATPEKSEQKQPQQPKKEKKADIVEEDCSGGYCTPIPKIKQNNPTTILIKPKSKKEKKEMLEKQKK